MTFELLRHRRGSVAALAAVALPVILGVAGLAIEYGDVLMTKMKAQRVADAAAYGGALAYSDSQTTAAMNAAIQRVAELNGVPPATVAGELVTSPANAGNQAVRAIVTTDVALGLTKLVRNTDQVTVTASAWVELRQAVNASASGIPCVMALNNAGTGVTLSGGTTLSAPTCTVASNAAVSVPNGTLVTTPIVTHHSAGLTAETLANIRPPAGMASVSVIRRTITDPLAGHPAVSAANIRMTSVSLMSGPAAPSTPASSTDLALDWSASSFTLGGCVGSRPNFGAIWNVTCSGAGPFNFRNLTVGGGITVNWSGPAGATYNFAGAITNGGAALNFSAAPGTYNIAQGITTGGGSTTTFAAGTYAIGPGSSNCSANGARYSICHTGTTLSFGGPSTFVLSAGIANSGGSTLTLGAGTGNSYRIGASNNGNAVWAGGGSKTTFAAATGLTGLFQMVGRLNVASGGGSCMALPAATEHDINGSFATAGGTVLGAGNYTVNGYVALGANGGGDVACGNATVGIQGSDVSFAVSASSTITSGTCAGTAFCVGAGYGHVTLTAPTSGTRANLLVVGPNTSSTNTAGANFAEGASGTSLSGVFYVPYGPFTLGGGANVGNGAGQCLEVIASQVSLTGGTTLATTCPGLGGQNVLPSTPGGIALVQ